MRDVPDRTLADVEADERRRIERIRLTDERMAAGDRRRLGRGRSRSVCTLDGARRWSRIIDAARDIGVSSAAVCNAIRFGHAIKGVRVRYA